MYHTIRYQDIKVSYLPQLDGGGMTFGQQYLKVIPAKLGHVGHVFEYCAGPGFIGFSLLAHGVCDRLTLADVNPAAVEACKKTIADNGLESKVSVYLSDCLDQIPETEKWDLVVSNPPHFDGNERQYRKNVRLVDPGLVIHKKFYRDVRRHLNTAGSVIFQENGHATREEDFLDMIGEGGLEVVEIFSERGKARARTRSRRMAGSGLGFFGRIMWPVERLLLIPTVERVVKDNGLYRAVQRLPLLTPSPYYFIWSKRAEATTDVVGRTAAGGGS